MSDASNRQQSDVEISSKMVDRCKDKKILPERSGKFVWRAIWRFTIQVKSKYNGSVTETLGRVQFANYINTKLRRFNSLHFCPVHRALVHAKECGEIIVIIVPIWVAAPWWPMVLSIKREESLEAESNPNGLVKKFLEHVDFLVENAISDAYRRRLDKS
ncbi:39586_t:CDS:2 [Gigaspora margarita]|uniref:39586_t:CDS:1 n=1 Tax=Gigaspora margarita TaxID=4874 RepID=A0ABN7V637_GIGMA|nr:39586_t:CDS:2 [Gigaspora margarita]